MTASRRIAGLHRAIGLAFALVACGYLSADGEMAERGISADAEIYRLGVNDVVSVRVLYHEEFGVEEATVGPDGRINLPGAGDIVFAGRTVEEAAEQIAATLRRELHEPQVSVRLVSRHVEPIYVLGAVRAPGALEVRESVSIAEAIALAQGLSETAAPRWAVLVDSEGRERRIDVLEALQERGEAGRVRVAPGETLLISTQFLVTVVGRVGAPGRYPVEEGDRIADAFATAGGLADDAAQSGTLVRADGTKIELDLEALADRGDAEANLVLSPGDMIVIPRASRRITLVGAFAEPGKYDFDPGDRVSDALALARDVDEDALSGSALLLRQDGSSRRVDLEALLRAAEGADDPDLQDGDTLVLPRATDRIAVVGMVASPGPLLLEPGMTVMSAIAAAGGWDQEKAHPEKTILWRQAPDGPEMMHVNARKLLRGDQEVDNPAMSPGDIVFVPRDPSMTRDEVARLLLGVSGLLRIAF